MSAILEQMLEHFGFSCNVTDFIIKNATKAELMDLLEHYLSEDDSGYREDIAMTIATMTLNYKIPFDIEDYADELYEEWKDKQMEE
jgi:hypothetical protein